jgi:hypothetical protein
MLFLLCIFEVKKSGSKIATEYVACIKDIGVNKNLVFRPEQQSYLLKLCDNEGL